MFGVSLQYHPHVIGSQSRPYNGGCSVGSMSQSDFTRAAILRGYVRPCGADAVALLLWAAPKDRPYCGGVCPTLRGGCYGTVIVGRSAVSALLWGSMSDPAGRMLWRWYCGPLRSIGPTAREYVRPCGADVVALVVWAAPQERPYCGGVYPRLRGGCCGAGIVGRSAGSALLWGSISDPVGRMLWRWQCGPLRRIGPTVREYVRPCGADVVALVVWAAPQYRPYCARVCPTLRGGCCGTGIVGRSAGSALLHDLSFLTVAWKMYFEYVFTMQVLRCRNDDRRSWI